VIVVDAGGFNDHAIIGELMSARAEPSAASAAW